jgi:hypothetical protein
MINAGKVLQEGNEHPADIAKEVPHAVSDYVW